VGPGRRPVAADRLRRLPQRPPEWCRRCTNPRERGTRRDRLDLRGRADRPWAAATDRPTASAGLLGPQRHGVGARSVLGDACRRSPLVIDAIIGDTHASVDPNSERLRWLGRRFVGRVTAWVSPGSADRAKARLRNAGQLHRRDRRDVVRRMAETEAAGASPPDDVDSRWDLHRPKFLRPPDPGAAGTFAAVASTAARNQIDETSRTLFANFREMPRTGHDCT